ncbi:MAG: hypothetical protein ACK4TK_03455 [Thiobacillaceae bacterium]
MGAILFDTREAWLQAFDGLLAEARRQLRILDQDLCGQGWETPARPSRLRDFLRTDRTRRVEILLHRSDYLTGHLPLLMRLLRDHPKQMGVRVYEALPDTAQAYVLGDDRLVLYRHRVDAWTGRLDRQDPAGVAVLSAHFQADWSRIAGGLGYTPLGL